MEGSLGLRPCGGGSGWNGSGSETARADIDSWSGVGGSRGILDRTRDGVSQTLPTRRRLMGLGDKTATARRPELAGQPTARSVIPFVETVISSPTPGEGPALRPALHQLRRQIAAKTLPHAVFPSQNDRGCDHDAAPSRLIGTCVGPSAFRSSFYPPQEPQCSTASPLCSPIRPPGPHW